MDGKTERGEQETVKQNSRQRQQNWCYDDLVAESLKWIRDMNAEHGVTEVAFSGGKDSIATLELVRQAGIISHAHYCNTTIDPPELVKFIRAEYPDVEEIKAPPFFKKMETNGFPTHNKRWCCDTQKKRPAKKYSLVFTGIRAQESCARQNRGRIVGRTHKTFAPIYFWRTEDVWNFIEENALPYPDLYNEGFDRVGCVVCPFVRGVQMMRNRNRWPKYYEAFEKQMTRQCVERGMTEQEIQTGIENYWLGGCVIPERLRKK